MNHLRKGEIEGDSNPGNKIRLIILLDLYSITTNYFSTYLLCIMIGTRLK